MKLKLRGVTIGITALMALIAGPAVASAVGSQEVADDTASSLVEDYTHPGAENFKDITLLKGDGGITMGKCDSATPDQITVESIGRTIFCFDVKGDTGWLSLRLDRVFLIGSGDQDVAAKITANGKTDTVNVEEGAIESIGVSDPNFGVLLELRATP